MSYTTISIPANSSILELLDRVIRDSKDDSKDYTTLVRLKESILNLYIKDYYLSKLLSIFLKYLFLIYSFTRTRS